ncbi:MAG: DUF1800 domain-containing protein [Pseudomonadales bacterium]
MTTSMLSMTRLGLSALLLLVLGACGGGGGGSSRNNPAPPIGNPAPPQPLTQAQLNSASMIAAQSTFGLTYEAIVDIAETGPETWLDEQFAVPVTTHKSLVDELLNARAAGEYAEITDDLEFLILSRRLAWWHRAFSAPDLVRQRVAFALSEIFVVADTVDALIINPYALATYYDLLLTHSFGNYRDLLKAVALHPAMGIYLSHVNNRKADPLNNTFPDENFAREVMQLFSIGLFELNLDGSIKLDGNGDPLPTYGNEQIREFAKIFTGLSYDGDAPYFGNPEPVYQLPMIMFDDFHEPGSKTLLGGQVVPAGQTGEQDIDAAVDNLFNHPNVGPFMARLLIQRLVTSNPSPAYISRIASIFNDNGAGVRGDLQAVIRAMLLDQEASTPTDQDQGGKLREPILRYIAFVRAFNPSSPDGYLFNYGFYLQNVLRQHPQSSPSVFNFFQPDHTPAGTLADADLKAPEFQITTATTIAGMTNVVDFGINADFVTDVQPPFETVSLDFSDYVAFADDLDGLLDRLDLVFTYGQLSDSTRSAIINSIQDVEDVNFRTRMAIYLLLISPDYAVQS